MKKIIFLPLFGLILTACTKTKLLYGENAYNHPEFDLNYYLEWDGIDKLEINNETNGNVFNLHSEDGLSAMGQGLDWGTGISDKENQWSYQNNLTTIDSSFCYGIISKLYDGRVRCDGLFQKSRVQLNKTGYATFFPKVLIKNDYIAFACRGGTNLSTPLGLSPGPTSVEGHQNDNPLYIDFKISFYKHITNSNKYDKVTYNLNHVNIQCDNGGGTNLVSFFNYNELEGAVGMSFEWSCDENQLEQYNISDDYKSEKNHLALMLYEVFIGNSEWY